MVSDSNEVVEWIVWLPGHHPVALPPLGLTWEGHHCWASIHFGPPNCIDSKLQDWVFKWLFRSEIWQVAQQHCCWANCQSSKWSDNFKPVPNEKVISQDSDKMPCCLVHRGAGLYSLHLMHHCPHRIVNKVCLLKTEDGHTLAAWLLIINIRPRNAKRCNVM